MDETTDTQSGQPIKRPRGRPRKIQPIPEPPRETPTIKEGASWKVSDPVWPDDEVELKRRHNEQVETTSNVSRAIEISALIEQTIEPNSVIQLKTEGKMGQFALVGEIDNDTLHCYQFMPDGSIDYYDVKMNECVVISGPKKGMRVIKYEKKEEAPKPED